MNVNHLRYFIRLASLQNYTEAALSLHITQPTLTNAIHKLEKELNSEFFYKSGRNVKLTANGVLFSQKVSQALDILDTGITNLNNINNQSEQIIIATIPALNTIWLPKIISDFKKTVAGKNVTFSFSSDSLLSSDLLDNLDKNKYDLCFSSKLDGYSNLEFTPIAQEELVVITPLNHPLSKSTMLKLSDLLPYDQITYSSKSGLSAVIKTIYQQSGYNPKTSYFVDDDLRVATLVANNLGIAIVPKRISLNMHAVKIIPFDTNGIQRLIYLCTSKNRQLNASTKSFIEFISKKPIFLIQ